MWGELEEEGRETRRTSSLRLMARLWPYVRPRLGTFLGAGALLLLSVAGELAAPLVLRRVIDVSIPSGSIGEIVLLSGLFAGLFGLVMALSYLQVVMATRIGLAVVRDVKGGVFSHMLTLSRSFFDRHPTGRLMARVESDGEKIRMLFSDVSMALLRSLALVVGTLAVMAATDLRITGAVLVLIVPVALLTVPVLRYMRTLYGRLRSAFARVSSVVAEYVRSIPVLQVFGATGTAAEKLHRAGEEYVRREVRAMGWEYTFWSFLGSCEIVAVAVILFAGRGGLASGVLTAGTVVLFVEYTRRLFQPILMFSSTLNQVQRGLASADRLFGILDTETLTPDGVLGRKAFPPDWSEIRFEDVWFRYAEDDDWALRGMSMTLRRGEMVALVGASGGGKSTVVGLLMRFYTPQRGRITVDGMDIADLRMEVWRSRLGMVLQDVNLFSGSLSENLTVFDPEVPREDQMAAMRAIDAEDLVERLPGGLDTEIAEGGTNLSMGERQLVSFARAVLRQPDILVLDEATSSVDPGTEKRIQRATDLMVEDRTALVVAHRLGTVLHASRILVIQGGRVIEEGPHAELLARGGVYSGLYRLQLGRSDGEEDRIDA
ncbi:MAG: ABC transporter ATP-binding protein [Candidatus Fermentibacteraceae bacterium]